MNIRPSLFLLLILLLGTHCLRAQSTQNRPDEIQMIQNLWGKEKREIVRQAMNLNPAEAEKFWPVYETYATARQKLGRTRLTLLEEYVQNYKNLSGEKAEQLTKRFLKNDIMTSKLEKKFFNKFKKALSPLQASQFMQVEDYLQTTLRSAMQENLPFARDLSKDQ